MAEESSVKKEHNTDPALYEKVKQDLEIQKAKEANKPTQNFDSGQYNELKDLMKKHDFVKLITKLDPLNQENINFLKIDLQKDSSIMSDNLLSRLVKDSEIKEEWLKFLVTEVKTKFISEKEDEIKRLSSFRKKGAILLDEEISLTRANLKIKVYSSTLNEKDYQTAKNLLDSAKKALDQYEIELNKKLEEQEAQKEKIKAELTKEKQSKNESTIEYNPKTA